MPESKSRTSPSSFPASICPSLSTALCECYPTCSEVIIIISFGLLIKCKGVDLTICMMQSDHVGFPILVSRFGEIIHVVKSIIVEFLIKQEIGISM